MAQKTVKRKFNLNIDEEKDIFLSSLNKKIRNAKKKILTIEELEKKGKDNLNKEQLDKLNSRGEVLEVIKYNESIKDLYYGALKAAQDEGKALPQQQETQPARKATTEEDKTEQAAPTKVEQQAPAGPTEEERQEERARIIRETVSKVLNLVHFAQLFRDQSSVQGFRQAFESQRGQFGIDSVPDFESFHEFFVKVFTFSESDRFGKVEDKINGAVEELESYINGEEQPALRNKTYRHLQTVVEGVAKAPFFLNHSAVVELPKARVAAEPSAIGSELRRVQEEAPAPVVQQEKVRSPEKETKAQPEPVKEQEAKQDWGQVEDDEDEEEVQEEEQQERTFEGEGGRTEEATATKEEKKADDGFFTVTAKYKEKKPQDTGYRGSGTRPYRGGRGEGRGGRGGYRGGDRRQEGEGQEGGYRPRPRRDDQQQGEGEGQEGQQRERGERGGYRGRGEGYRGRGEGYRGRGEGYRGGRGGYRGGDRRQEGQQGERTQTAEGTTRTENA